MIPLPGPVIPSGVREARNPSSSRVPFRLGLPDLEGAPSFASFAKGGLLRSNATDVPLLVSKEVVS